MKIAIPIWDGRVSPVMDTASRLLILKIKNKREVSRSFLPLPKLNRIRCAQFIANVGIDILICGAISRPYEKAILHQGIKLYAWIMGDVDEIISAYIADNLRKKDFHLPGCCRRRRQRNRNRFDDETANFQD